MNIKSGKFLVYGGIECDNFNKGERYMVNAKVNSIAIMKDNYGYDVYIPLNVIPMLFEVADNEI